jgi:hypothetical protein
MSDCGGGGLHCRWGTKERPRSGHVRDTYVGWGRAILTSVFRELLLKVKNAVFRHDFRKKSKVSNEFKNPEVGIDIF